MAQLEEGWPLGLQPLNGRVGLRRDSDYSGSISYNTLLSASPSSSTVSSSDLDTVSTGSFFHERGGGITLGRLLGVSGSCRRRKSPEASKEKKSNKSRSVWLFFSLCSRDSTDGHSGCIEDCPSLGHFLAVERRTASSSSSGEQMRRKNDSFFSHGPDEFAPHYAQTNTLFVNGQIVAAPLAQSRVGRE